MKTKIGELEKGWLAFSLIVGALVAAIIYSRFTFKKELSVTDNAAVFDHELRVVQAESVRLEQKLEAIEQRLAVPSAFGSDLKDVQAEVAQVRQRLEALEQRLVAPPTQAEKPAPKDENK